MIDKRILLPLVFIGTIILARPAEAMDQVAGMELGYLSVPLLTEDPYSFAASAGVWYELNRVGDRPWVLGAWLAAAGFRPMDEDFGTSTMYYGGFELGYDLTLFRTDAMLLSLRPMTRLGWYFRSVEFLDTVEWGSRPFLSAGMILGLRSGNLDLGITSMISVPMDNRPVVLIGLLQRLGLWF
jgi:hypothetical protein